MKSTNQKGLIKTSRGTMFMPTLFRVGRAKNPVIYSANKDLPNIPVRHYELQHLAEKHPGEKAILFTTLAPNRRERRGEFKQDRKHNNRAMTKGRYKARNMGADPNESLDFLRGRERKERYRAYYLACLAKRAF